MTRARVVALICGWIGLLFVTGPLRAETGYTATKFPIVLVHGMFGFDELLGVVDYWYKIPADLERGGARVFVARVSPLDATAVRGEQLLAQVEEIVAITGSEKVHLFGHSHGAPTSRYVAGVRPDLVASVTSIGGVNRGSKVADRILAGLPEGTLLESLLVTVVNLMGEIINGLSSTRVESRQDVRASLNNLSSAGLVRFNKDFPAGTGGDAGVARSANGVAYYSFGGTSVLTRLLDPLDYAFALTHILAFGREPSDGLVGQKSTHLGEVIRDDYPLNHLDLVNQLLGSVPMDPRPLYRQHANRLKIQGM